MIPYADLVARLQSWRARQGLPVSASPDVHASAPSPPPATADEISDDHLEVIDEVQDRGDQYLSLSAMESDETTPLGGFPEPTGRSR